MNPSPHLPLLAIGDLEPPQRGISRFPRQGAVPQQSLPSPEADPQDSRWPVPTQGTARLCGGEAEAEPPVPRWNRDGGTGRVAMEIFSLADALGRCKKRLCPPRCAAQCQPDPAETGSLCNRPPASPTATTATGRPASSRAPRQHRRGETESPPKATARSWPHLPWPQPHVTVTHQGAPTHPWRPPAALAGCFIWHPLPSHGEDCFPAAVTQQSLRSVRAPHAAGGLARSPNGQSP